MTILVRILALLALVPATVCSAESAGTSPATTGSSKPSVAVIFALKSAREHPVAWHKTLTAHAAIATANVKAGASWKEAWRYRESFWTRNFPNPHSFWARMLAGEKATGYTYIANSPRRGRAAELQPGDRIYVDLAPVH